MKVVQNPTEEDEVPAQGHKRVHSPAHDSEADDVADADNVIDRLGVKLNECTLTGGIETKSEQAAQNKKTSQSSAFRSRIHFTVSVSRDLSRNFSQLTN